MYKLLVLLALLSTSSMLVAAQDKRFEVFGGYSYLMTDLEESDAPLDRFDNLDGFNVAATGYFTKRFGITGDFSAHFRNETEQVSGGVVRFKARSYRYLGGPQVSFRNDTRVTPFIRFLAGVENNRFSFQATPTGGSVPTTSESVSVTDFSLALGGGLDVRLNDRLAIRVFQIDYNPDFVRRRPDIGINESRRLDNVRFSIGIVFK